MRSAFSTVDSLWAITSVVRPCISLSSARWMRRSDSVSRADVASSSISTGASLSRARAIAILCRCPPESSVPRSPTPESRPYGSSAAKSVT